MGDSGIRNPGKGINPLSTDFEVGGASPVARLSAAERKESVGTSERDPRTMGPKAAGPKAALAVKNDLTDTSGSRRPAGWTTGEASDREDKRLERLRLKKEREAVTSRAAETFQRPPDSKGEAPKAPILETTLDLPRRRAPKAGRQIFSFFLCVVVPTLIVAGYYGLFATNQYVSEFRFTVRDATTAAAGSSPSTSTTVVSLLGPSASDSTSNNYIVADYLRSRQAIDDLTEKFDVRKLYSGEGIDWLSRYSGSASDQRFEPYWQRMVTASYDQITGIVYVQVRAFAPDDAYKIAAGLLSLSEDLINKIANRTQLDVVRFAEGDVGRAEERLKSIRADLTRFRVAEQVIDPQAGIVTSNVLLAQTIRANVAQLQTDLASLDKQKLGPNAPVREVMQSRLRAAREQLAAVESEVASVRDGSNPLSKVVAEYERLDLERQFAQAMVLATRQALEQAKSNSLSQRLYITPFVRPAVPGSSTYPKKLIAVGIALVVCVVLWMVGRLVFRSFREHLV